MEFIIGKGMVVITETVTRNGDIDEVLNLLLITSSLSPFVFTSENYNSSSSSHS